MDALQIRSPTTTPSLPIDAGYSLYVFPEDYPFSAPTLRPTTTPQTGTAVYGFNEPPHLLYLKYFYNLAFAANPLHGGSLTPTSFFNFAPTSFFNFVPPLHPPGSFFPSPHPGAWVQQNLSRYPGFIGAIRPTTHYLNTDLNLSVLAPAFSFLSRNDSTFVSDSLLSLLSTNQTFTDPILTADPILTFLLDRIFAEPSPDPLKSYEELNLPNWDGYGAEPITPETLKYARRILRVMPDTLGPPDIAPAGDGSIALEWVPETGPLNKLFLDIGPGEQWRAYWKLRTGEFGRLPSKGFTADTKPILQQLFDDLTG